MSLFGNRKKNNIHILDQTPNYILLRKNLQFLVDAMVLTSEHNIRNPFDKKASITSEDRAFKYTNTTAEDFFNDIYNCIKNGKSLVYILKAIKKYLSFVDPEYASKILDSWNDILPLYGYKEALKLQAPSYYPIIENESKPCQEMHFADFTFKDVVKTVDGERYLDLNGPDYGYMPPVSILKKNEDDILESDIKQSYDVCNSYYEYHKKPFFNTFYGFRFITKITILAAILNDKEYDSELVHLYRYDINNGFLEILRSKKYPESNILHMKDFKMTIKKIRNLNISSLLNNEEPIQKLRNFFLQREVDKYEQMVCKIRPFNITNLVEITPEEMLERINNGFCCICYNETEICNFMTSCKHLFHLECIKTWFESKRHLLCPYCRQGFKQKKKSFIMRCVGEDDITFSENIKSRPDKTVVLTPFFYNLNLSWKRKKWEYLDINDPIFRRNE